MIHFREVLEPSKAWHVEFYGDEGTMFPIAIAFLVSVGSDTAQLNYIFVADQWRGQGIASQLLAACKERWPKLLSTGSMHEDGTTQGMVVEHLLRKFTNHFDHEEE